MEQSNYPSLRSLTSVWLIILFLSIGTLFTGQVDQPSTIGLLWMLGLLGVTLFKSILILDYFLDLKAASGSWNKVFISLICIILLIIYGLYAVSFWI